MTLAEANQILKNCVGEFSRVEIMPLSHTGNSNLNANNSRPSSAQKSKDLFLINFSLCLFDLFGLWFCGACFRFIYSSYIQTKHSYRDR